MLLRLSSVILAGLLAVPAVSFAQAPAPTPAPPDTRAERDMALNLAEPDFTTVNLPTTLRLPRTKSAFRVTHRFARSLSDGSFGDLAGDLFGIDRGAQIGLEYRIGITRGVAGGN